MIHVYSIIILVLLYRKEMKISNPKSILQAMEKYFGTDMASNILECTTELLLLDHKTKTEKKYTQEISYETRYYENECHDDELNDLVAGCISCPTALDIRKKLRKWDEYYYFPTGKHYYDNFEYVDIQDIDLLSCFGLKCDLNCDLKCDYDAVFFSDGKQENIWKDLIKEEIKYKDVKIPEVVGKIFTQGESDKETEQRKLAVAHMSVCRAIALNRANIEALNRANIETSMRSDD